jgi:bifunctional isochorismate lyase/aryl carrier protein
MSERLTPESVRAGVAEVLHRDPGNVRDDENLFEGGMDSIRLLTLLDKWRDAGAAVSFMELAEQPTLAAWVRLLGSWQPAALDA